MPCEYRDKQRIIYTSPLKALSNQVKSKYSKCCACLHATTGSITELGLSCSTFAAICRNTARCMRSSRMWAL